MQESDLFLEFAKRMYSQFDGISDRFNHIDERISDLETQLQRIFCFIEFHLGKEPKRVSSVASSDLSAVLGSHLENNNQLSSPSSDV